MLISLRFMDEEIWLKQLEEGKDSAFQTLFETYYARLCAFACRYMEEEVAAEDIVQDVLYELWMGKLSFKNVLALKSWLYQVVRNRCLDTIKHRQVEIKYLEEQRYKEDSEFFLHQILEEEVYALLKEAMAVLPEQIQKVFELTFSGQSNAEIAEILHVSLDAVKSSKKRGKKLLQDKLKGLVYLFILFDSEEIFEKK